MSHNIIIITCPDQFLVALSKMQIEFISFEEL